MTVDTLQAVIDHATANRRCPDCGGRTVLLTDPDELACPNDRCGWSQAIETAAVA